MGPQTEGDLIVNIPDYNYDGVTRVTDEKIHQ